MRFLPFLLITLIPTAHAANECEFRMRLIPGLNPLRQIDANGKVCRGNVELPFCGGYCKTSESGTHGFPPRIQNSSVCTLVKTSERRVELKDCDPGASDDIKFLMIDEGTECQCSSIPLEQSHA